MVKYNVLDLNEGRNYPHYWELCVGSCHAATLLREDVREQIRKAHDEIGFKYIRFHGLFDDDMSVVIQPMIPIGPNQISFFNINCIFDFLLSIGMKPFIELGFMPEAFASGNTTCFHYKGNVTMPKDDNQWADFIKTFITHLENRYGKEEVRSWFFEVWNEPNLGFFFDGTMLDYFHLYEITSKAIKEVDSELKVGGPATSNNMWILEFKDFCKESNSPVDFISTHHYPSDDPLSTLGMNTKDEKGPKLDVDEIKQMLQEDPAKVQEMFAAYNNKENKNPRDILKTLTVKAKKEAGDLPLYYTEWNAGRFDLSYAAAGIISTLAQNENLVEGYSYWCISDVFEELGLHGLPFNNEFGLVNVYGTRKPSYRLFEELHKAGDIRLDVTGDTNRTCEVIAFKDDTKVSVFVYNHDIEERDIKVEEVELTLEGQYSKIIKGVIDKTHCAPYATWEKQGKPAYPTKEQLKEIDDASFIQFEELDNKQKTFKITAEVESVTIFHFYK